MNDNKDKLLLTKLCSLKILYRKKKLIIKSYEELVNKIFMETLTNNRKKNLIIGIEKNLSFILMLIIISIKGYYDNMGNVDTKLLDILVDGDRVVYQGKICMFRKISTIKDKKYVTLENAGKLTTHVMIEKAHLITQYSGQAKRINKLEGFYHEENSIKSFIADFFDVNPDKLNGVITESTLFVVNGKEKLFDLINDISIEYMGKSYLISKLFPLAYFTSDDHYEYFKGNKTKENVLLKFTSNISTALDLVKNDKHIKRVILIGDRTYKDSIETEVRVMGMLRSLHKLIIFDSWESTFDFSYLVQADEAYSLYAFTKECILNEVNMFEYDNIGKLSEVQEESRYLALNLRNRMIDICLIDKYEEIYQIITNIIQSINVLCHDGGDNIKTLEFIKLAYQICNISEQSILPLNWCQDNKNNILTKVDRLKEINKVFHIARMEFKVMKEIVVNIAKLVCKISVENIKFNELTKCIDTSSKNILVVKNHEEVKDLERYIMFYKLRNLKVTKLQKNFNYRGYDHVIFSFPYDNRYFNIFNTATIANVEFLLHGREYNRLGRLIRNNNNMLKLITENNILRYTDKCEPNEVLENIYLDDNNIKDDINSLEATIETTLKENWLRIFIHDDMVTSSYNNATKVIVKTIIRFEDNKYAFLSDNYQGNIIDRRNNDIKQKEPKDIDVGDEIVFVNTKTSINGDIIKDTIEKLLGHNDFFSIYGKYYELNSLWKDLLLAYMNEHNMNLKDICNMFKLYDETLEPSTLANWLNGNIIGPRNLKHITVISSIIDDDNLTSQLDNVINSCRSVRSLQVQVRKTIAKMVINSVTLVENQDDTIYNLIRLIIGNFNEYAYIGTVASIENIEVRLSGSHVNRIIEEEIE